MAVVLVGELVTFSFTASTTGAVTRPDGASGSITTSGSGSSWTGTYTPALAGRYSIVWTSGSTVRNDVLDVWPAAPTALISLDDAAQAVGGGQAVSAAHRDLLPLFIAAAGQVVEDITGPLGVVAKTETFDGEGRNALLLPVTGVTVTGVTVDGVAYTTFVVDGPAGIVYAGATGAGSWSSAGRRNVVVSYTVGSTASVPAAVRLAVMEQTKFLWQVHRQGATRDDLGYTPSGFAVPRMVQELALTATTTAAPGFA